MPFILELLKQNKVKFLSFFLFSFFTSIFGVLILVFINEYLLKNTKDIPIFYFLALLVIFFISSCFTQLSLSIFGQNFIFKMQRRVVKQILDTPMLKLAQVGKAKIIASLSSDVRNISFGLMSFPEFLQAGILILCTCFYLFYLSPSLFLLCFVWIFFVFISNNFLIMKVYKYFRKARESDDLLQHNYQNILEGHRELTINNFRAKYYYENEFEKNAKEKKKNSIIGSVLNNLSNNWTNICLLALVGVQFYIALHFSLTSIENATTIALSILFLRTSLTTMISSFPTLILAKIALDKIAKLELNTYEKEFNLPKQKVLWNKIIFKNACFSYNDDFSLKPVNLELKKGELVFLIGKNGSGKSTFSLLLAGLMSPNSGALYLDDEKITQENIQKYRSLISIVFSDFHLFTQTLVDENFASDEKIAYWLKFLELEEKTQVLNNEIVTTKLSTGQKKRLAMFIALLEQRDVLILDEWAADQDPVFRKFFYQKLLPLLKEQGKTIFAITHDDKYFDMADRIFLAQNGVIEELLGEDRKILALNAVEKF